MMIDFRPCLQLEYSSPHHFDPFGNVTDANISWHATLDCDIIVDNPRSFAVRVRCATVGVKRIGLDVTWGNGSTALQDAVHIAVFATSSLCFDWYIAPANIQNIVHHASETLTIRVWIYEASITQGGEQSHSALAPSSSSQDTTQEFFNLGENPAGLAWQLLKKQIKSCFCG